MTNTTLCSREDCANPRREGTANVRLCAEHGSYYLNNQEVQAQKQREYRQKNPEFIKRIQREWREANEGHLYTETSGYVKYVGFNHPAASPSGLTGYHRIVLWDKLSGKDAPCNWCGRQLYWSKSYPKHQDALITDHVDTNKQNNDPSNLVPSCGKCNVSREGGRKQHVRAVTGPCSVSFCDRDAKARVGDYSDEYAGQIMCRTHYNHVWQGKEPAVIGPYKRGGFGLVTDAGRECMTCHEFKSWEHFYTRKNGRVHAHCKPCEIVKSQENKAKREARGIECSDSNCAQPALNLGLCKTHYGRAYYERTNAA